MVGSVYTLLTKYKGGGLCKRGAVETRSVNLTTENIHLGAKSGVAK